MTKPEQPTSRGKSAVEPVLFIAPLPPPVDGQSKASDRALKALTEAGIVTRVVNLNRRNLSRSLGNQVLRMGEVFRVYGQILRYRWGARSVYFSLSESTLGNLKDLIAYVLLLGKLKDTTLQMLGGAGMNAILNRRPLMSLINRLFMRRMKGVIVEGSRGFEVFCRAFDPSKIFPVRNFADEYLFVPEASVLAKFLGDARLQVLYLSNLIVEKGYQDLLDGFLALPSDVRAKFNLKFVGGFPSEAEHARFMESVSPHGDIEYLGKFIDGEPKKALYAQTHIFCLPTYYPYEGQPISILEAYASGCAVLTTPHAGIPDVFEDGVNGYFVEPQSPAAISRRLTDFAKDRDRVERFALMNHELADSEYQPNRYMREVLEVVLGKDARASP